MPGFALAAIREIGRADVVQMHTPMLETLLVALLCRPLSTPLVMSHHGDLVLPAGLFNRFTERSVTAMMGAAGRLADRVTTYSDDYAAHSAFLQQFADHLTAIAPPVTIPAPVPDQVRAQRAELGLEGKRIVGFAGRFVEEKGFDFLLAAVPLIKQHVPEVHFLFAGETNVAYERFYRHARASDRAAPRRYHAAGLIRDPQTAGQLSTRCATCSRCRRGPTALP